MKYRKILVVDDIKKNIQVLGNILGKEGYAVSYAIDGPKALDMVSREEFDLILLDVMMPGMDGYEVCRRLKENGGTKDIPILFLTAKSEQDDVVRGLREGAVDYLTKPFNTEELVARVGTHMALRHAQRVILERNTELEDKNQRLRKLLEENQRAMSEIKILRGILPICSRCKKIRDDEGYWNQIETYISRHSEAEFTHGLCTECAKVLYPDYFSKKDSRKDQAKE